MHFTEQDQERLNGYGYKGLDLNTMQGTINPLLVIERLMSGNRKGVLRKLVREHNFQLRFNPNGKLDINAIESRGNGVLGMKAGEELVLVTESTRDEHDDRQHPTSCSARIGL